MSIQRTIQVIEVCARLRLSRDNTPSLFSDGSGVPERWQDDLSLPVFEVHWTRSLPAVQRPKPTKGVEYKVWSAKKLFLTYKWAVVNFTIEERHKLTGLKQVVTAVNVQRLIRRRVKGKRAVVFGFYDRARVANVPLTRGEVFVEPVKSFELKKPIQIGQCWQEPGVRHLQTRAVSIGEQVQVAFTMSRRLTSKSPFLNEVHEDHLVGLVPAIFH